MAMVILGSLWAVLALIGAVAPPLLLLRFVYRRRTLPPRHRGRLTAVYAISFMTVIPALALEGAGYFLLQLLDLPPVVFIAAGAAGIGLIEEGVKFAFVYGFLRRRATTDPGDDPVLVSTAVSLGFATVENVMYVVGGYLALLLVFTGLIDVAGAEALDDLPDAAMPLIIALVVLTLIVARALTAIPAHGFLGVTMGYLLARARRTEAADGRRALPVRALLIPAAWHGIYDFPVLYLSAGSPPPVWGPVLVLAALGVIISLWVGGIRLLNRAPRFSPVIADGGTVPRFPPAASSPGAMPPPAIRFCAHCGAPVPAGDVLCRAAAAVWAPPATDPARQGSDCAPACVQ